MALPRKLLLVVALAVAAPLVGAAALRLWVDPEAFKPGIEEFVRHSTGLSLRVEGPLRLSWFPWLGIEIGRASLGGVAGFEEEPFLRVEGAAIKVRLAALVRGELEAGAIRLDGPEITLVRAADGRANWQALPVREVRLERERVVVRSDAGQAAFRYQLEGLSVSGGRLTFEDRASGRTVRASDVRVDVGRIATGETSDVTLGFTLEAERPRVAATTRLTGKLRADPGNLVFAFDHADLGLDARSPDLPLRRLSGTGRADVTVNGQDARVSVKGIALSATAAGGMFPEEGTTATLSGNFDWSATEGRLVFSDMVLEGSGLRATGRLDGETGPAGAPPRFVWQFATNAFDPRALLASVGITLSGLPEGALSLLETRGEAVFTPSALGLAVDPLRLDGQHIALTVHVEHFDKPAIRFELTADALDADRYLAAGREGGPRSDRETGGAAPSTSASVTGRIRLGRLGLRGLALTNVQADVAASGGTVTARPVSFGLAGGTVSGGLSLETARAAPSLRLGATVSGVAVKPVLAALAGQSALSGTLSAKADISCAGGSPEALRASLSGPVSLRLENGQVEGFSVSPQLLASLKALVGLADLSPQGIVQATGTLGQAVSASRQGSTPISLASAAFQFHGGVGTTRDVLVRAPQGQVTGAGSVDLGRERLDLALRADIAGVGSVPLLVGGGFASPDVSVDKGALAKQAVTSVPRMLEKGVKETGKNVLDSVKGVFRGP